MKLVIISLIAITLLFLQATNVNSLKGSLAQEVDRDLPQWNALFSNIFRPEQLCKRPDLTNPPKKVDLFANAGTDGNLPHPKANRFTKLQGSGQSAYFFDFLDDALQSEMVAHFIKVYQAAKKIVVPQGYSEPYSLDKMIFFYSQGKLGKFVNSTNTGSAVPDINADPMVTIRKYNSAFNQEIWNTGITVGQVEVLVGAWNWYKPIRDIDFARKLVNSFDFDGDGRLNPSEFILFSIINNEKIFGLAECKEHCYAKLLREKIDPMHSFIDCDHDGYISAENIWIGLQNLKRKDIKKYSMYTCQLPSILNQGYRTLSASDFILKNSERVAGYLNINEFRHGILMGFWERQTDFSRIVVDDSKNLKSTRWGNKGSDDLICQNILSLIPKANMRASAAQNPSKA